MGFSVSIGLKESGGLTISPWEKPVVITKGSHVKLGIIVMDSAGRTVNTQPYTVKVRIPLADNTFTTKTTTPINYLGGEAELALVPADTSLLAIGNEQNMEVEIALVSTPTTIMYIPAKKAFSVGAPLFT